MDVPVMQFLKISGEGNPNTSKVYQEAVESLFSLSYHIKFSIKKGKHGINYGVMPLEGLWWADDMEVFKGDDKSQWKWTMMIMQPEVVTESYFRDSLEALQKKKALTALSDVVFETYEEGKSAQLMHKGPFSEEGPSIKRLHQFIENLGYKLSGMHHEIYLSDIRRAAPSRWKTILRQPVQ